MWLLVPIWNIPPDISLPNLLCLALDLWAVFFELLQLCRVLDMAKNGLKKRVWDVTDVGKHVDVLDEALPRELVKAGYRHRSVLAQIPKRAVEETDVDSKRKFAKCYDSRTCNVDKRAGPFAGWCRRTPRVHSRGNEIEVIRLGFSSTGFDLSWSAHVDSSGLQEFVFSHKVSEVYREDTECVFTSEQSRVTLDPRISNGTLV